MDFAVFFPWLPLDLAVLLEVRTPGNARVLAGLWPITEMATI